MSNPFINSADTDITVLSEKSFEAHQSTVISLVLEEQSRRIFSSGYDKTMNVWNLRGDENIQAERERYYDQFRSDTNTLKMLHEFVLVGTDLGKVHVFKMEPPSEVKVFELRKFLKERLMNAHEEAKVIDLTNIIEDDNPRMFCRDRFGVLLDLNSNGVIVIMEYPSGRILHFLGKLRLNVLVYSDIQHSLTVPNTVFVSTSVGLNENVSQPIVLIDYKTEKIIKEFVDHDLVIFGIDTFVNKENREILLAGGSEKRVYMYDVMTTKIMKTVKCGQSVCSFLRVGLRHYIVGGGSNHFNVIDVSNENISKTETPLSTFQLGKKGSLSYIFLESLILLTDLSKRCNIVSNEIEIAGGSSDGKIYLIKLKIPGIEVKSDLEEEDLKERIDFVLNSDSFIGHEIKEFKISIGGSIFLKHSILKCFF